MAMSIGGSTLNTTSLAKAQQSQENAMERISSGKRINSAKDDVAGLAISDRFNSQFLGLNQAMRNVTDGVSMVQTADSALGESTSILQRMRELSLQSGNGIYNRSDRASMNAEFSQLQSELDRIAGTTTFNDQNLLNGDMAGSGVSFQVGTEAGDLINVQIPGAAQDDLGTADLDILSQEGAQASLSSIYDALSQVSSMRGDLGAVQSQFESSLDNLSNVAQNTAGAKSRIADADMAKEISALTRNTIIEKAGIAMQAQANQSAQSILKLL